MKRKIPQSEMAFGSLDFKLTGEESTDGDRVERQKRQREQDKLEAAKLQTGLPLQ